MKNSQGISLISLVVTIVVVIVLVGVSIYTGIVKNIDDAQNTMDYNEIFELNEAVAQRALLNRLNSDTYALVGSSGEFSVTLITYSGDEPQSKDVTYSTINGWYKIDKENFSDLNLENVKKEYLVNYETCEVIAYSPITYEGKKYSLASELRDALGGGDYYTAVNKYNEAKGVNAPYLVEGMVPVKRDGDSWVVTSSDDTEWYDYAGDVWANIMLLDELTLYGMDNAAVRKANISDMVGQQVITPGSMFVWIPRFTRGYEDGVLKVVYSKLTQDYFDEPSAENVLGAFNENGVELTGFWISKYDASYIMK